MNFLTYGDKNKQSILFIHGMASTAFLCYEPLLEYLKNYYVILAEVDGHSDSLGELDSLADNFTNSSVQGAIYRGNATASLYRFCNIFIKVSRL